MNYAPVLITVYNRYSHFRKCVESLANCEGAEQTDLFIAIDAPAREEDREAVTRIYEYSKDIEGFKSVTIFMREENLGSRENSKRAREAVFDKYDRMIRSEDDNIFASDFLTYINTGLEVFKDRKDIHAICGYNYPIEMPKEYHKDHYIWTGFNAWGSGIWKDRSESITREPPLEELSSFLKDRKMMKALDAVAGHYKPALQHIVDTGKYTGDTIVCYHLFKNSQYCVFPSVSRVRNIGHDGSGLHCGVDNTDKFHKQPIADGSTLVKFDVNIEPDESIYKILSRYFRRSRLSPLKRVVKKIIRYERWRKKVSYKKTNVVGLE